MWNSFKKRVVFYGRIPGSPSFTCISSPGHRIHCLPLSTVAERQYDVYSPQVKKTFAYTDYSKIEDEKKQGCFLTKSILKPGLPSIYERPLNLDQSLLDSIYEEFEGHLLDSFLFCFGEEELHRKKFSVMNSFLNMAQTTWRKTTSSYPTNMTRSLFYKQHVTASYCRAAEYNVQIAGKPKKSFLMMSKSPLNQFASDEEVASSVAFSTEWDEVYEPIFNFRIADVNNVNKAPFITDGPYSNPHTLFITADKKNVEMKRLIGHGILYSFAHAYLHALSKPENTPGMKEIEPVNIQCVISDGRILSFICHQLNTLNFQDETGVKNFLWIDDNIEMFKYAHLKVPGNKKYKDSEVFNPDFKQVEEVATTE